MKRSPHEDPQSPKVILPPARLFCVTRKVGAKWKKQTVVAHVIAFPQPGILVFLDYVLDETNTPVTQNRRSFFCGPGDDVEELPSGMMSGSGLIQ